MCFVWWFWFGLCLCCGLLRVSDYLTVCDLVVEDFLDWCLVMRLVTITLRVFLNLGFHVFGVLSDCGFKPLGFYRFHALCILVVSPS